MGNVAGECFIEFPIPQPKASPSSIFPKVGTRLCSPCGTENTPMGHKRHYKGLWALDPNSAVNVTHSGMFIYDSQVELRAHILFYIQPHRRGNDGTGEGDNLISFYLIRSFTLAPLIWGVLYFKRRF